MKLKPICLFLLGFTLCSCAQSRPPRDLIWEPNVVTPEESLSENDIIFSRENIGADPKKSGIMKIGFNVNGRSLPNRYGRVIYPLSKNTTVKVMKLSKDKQWVGVKVLKNEKKVWVPLGALPDFSEEALKNSKKRSSSKRRRYY